MIFIRLRKGHSRYRFDMLFPWKRLVSWAARYQGFADPVRILQQVQRFAQPAEVAQPLELLRAGAVLHARGLINTQAVQHNLDWVWPYWIARQFDPRDDSFIPRAFSATHINLTHRNWTAVGSPDSDSWMVVDPRGLVMPFWDSWSLDFWIVCPNRQPLLPGYQSSIRQYMNIKNGMSVVTECAEEGAALSTSAVHDGEVGHVALHAQSEEGGALVVSLRPYNAEGVSFIEKVERHKNGWEVNDSHCIEFSESAEKHLFSTYAHGDVFYKLSKKEEPEVSRVSCDIEMASAAAVFPLQPGVAKDVSVQILPHARDGGNSTGAPNEATSICRKKWDHALQGIATLEVPDRQFLYQYDAAVRTLLLLCPEEVYPGPYTYKRFWFRDAAYMLYALLRIGASRRVARALEHFHKRQRRNGYFHSQEGEWDSNGQVLWIVSQFHRYTGRSVGKDRAEELRRGAEWIRAKRVRSAQNPLTEGLLPAGFSAEHFGPSDCYYWDDMWSIGGLEALAELAESDERLQRVLRPDVWWKEAQSLRTSLDRSIELTEAYKHWGAVATSPHRRMDGAAVGALAAGYPLGIWKKDDPRLLRTVDYLLSHCTFDGAFYHEIAHSGLNAYLTLHLAQVLLRSGDPRYWQLVENVGALASETGQWPEAIHPRTKGGCMGDGQHGWAAAEWVLMVSALFVLEEEGGLCLCRGLPRDWLTAGSNIAFGPAHTSWGTVAISLACRDTEATLSIDGEWNGTPPPVSVEVPGYQSFQVSDLSGQREFRLHLETES